MFKSVLAVFAILLAPLRRSLRSVDALVERALDWRELSMSWASMLSRRFGGRAMLAAGVLATGYALFLFVQARLEPDAPKPSHDAILKSRWSSPAPSGGVVILDIDERTLAMLAPEHGRWPWGRDVLADGLQKVADLGARAVLFNVMLSDPDRGNPDGDAAMEVTAQLLPNVAYPLVRLNPANDKSSGLRVGAVPGAAPGEKADTETTIAALLPMFAPMHERLGVANHKPDDDGVVRKHPAVWEDARLRMPSLALRTAELAGVATANVPSVIALNWRNKNGRYPRVSFSDLLGSAPGDAKMAVFKDAIVVLGASAPGIGQTKGTSVKAIEDDNEILATAVDDLVSGTWLRTLPDWLVLAINLAAVWTLVWMAITGSRPALLNRAFVVVQASMGGITLASASYTSYLVDLSESMSFGLAVFGAIKMIQSLDDGWSRAKSGFRRAVRSTDSGTLLVIGYRDSRLRPSQAQALQRALESVVGMPGVIRIDDLFGGDSFAKESCSDYSCQIVRTDDDSAARISDVLARAEFSGMLLVEQHAIDAPWNPDDASFRREVSLKVLRNCSKVLDGHVR